jgi:hypothetical protein
MLPALGVAGELLLATDPAGLRDDAASRSLCGPVPRVAVGGCGSRVVDLRSILSSTVP